MIDKRCLKCSDFNGTTCTIGYTPQLCEAEDYEMTPPWDRKYFYYNDEEETDEEV